jgi:CheY-like chemotaxis protein
MSKKAQVLIIEDDEDTLEAMKVTLEAQDFRVVTALNPDEGFQQAKKDTPDLIILDVMFGRKQKAIGFDYAVRMKQDSDLASIPILMVTAVNMKYPALGFSPKTDGDYLPVDEFINKPADPVDLVQKVKKLLTLKISKWANWPDPASS